MGTTLVCAIRVDNKLYFANIGDSRAYIYQNDKLQQITVDHDIATKLKSEGVLNHNTIAADNYNNTLYNSLNINVKYKIDWFIENNFKGIFILMSDGVYNMVKDTQLQIMIANTNNLEALVYNICNKADENGGIDNSTILVGKI